MVLLTLNLKRKNIIEVIPSSWIKNVEECFWLLKFGSIKLQSAIKRTGQLQKMIGNYIP